MHGHYGTLYSSTVLVTVTIPFGQSLLQHAFGSTNLVAHQHLDTKVYCGIGDQRKMGEFWRLQIAATLAMISKIPAKQRSPHSPRNWQET